MSVDTRPAWMTPIVYNDEPTIPVPVNPDETPLDYSRGADREAVFGDDLDDDEEGEEGGAQ